MGTPKFKPGDVVLLISPFTQKIDTLAGEYVVLEVLDDDDDPGYLLKPIRHVGHEIAIESNMVYVKDKGETDEHHSQ